MYAIMHTVEGGGEGEERSYDKGLGGAVVVLVGDDLSIPPGLPQPLHGRRLDEDHEGLELCGPQVLQRLQRREEVC